MKIFKALVANKKWSDVRRMQDIKALKSMYFWLLITPILAKSINQIETISFGEGIFQTMAASISLPFSWQILYFGALFIVVGDITYSAFCPEIIKNFKNYSSFEETKRTLRELDGLAENINCTKYFENKKKLTSYNSHGNIKNEDMKALFWIVYEQGDLFRKKIILTSASFYIAGLLFVGFIIIQNTFAVMKVTLSL